VLPLPSEAISPEVLRPLKRVEYNQLVKLGFFEDEKVELLYGLLVTMSPQGNEHLFVIRRLTKLSMFALGDRAEIQGQGPVAASDESEPEPDVAVLPVGDYLDDYAAHCHLVVEVANSSRKKDLGLKAHLYAEMGVLDYWVVDIQRRAVVVHRAPVGDHYEDVRALTSGAEIALLAFPDIVVRVDDVLPPA
jgi:Uma2 family endonuclease